MNISCSCCGVDFEIIKSEHSKSLRKGQNNFFCSRDCYYKHRSQRAVVEVKCGNCSKLFTRYKREVRIDSPNFCSKSCAAIQNNKGKVRNYTTGKGSYRERALACKKNECLLCGFSEFYALEVHHLDLNRSNNKLENLVILCANCHRGVHRSVDLKNKLNGVITQVGKL